jgi:hypothetical protein
MDLVNAIRFLEHQARLCRDRDSHEAFCLLMPAILRQTGARPMNDAEAKAFAWELHEALKNDFRRAA